MVKNGFTNSIKLSLIFHCLSDSTRRKIIERLAKKPMTVTEIKTPYKISMPAITKHLKVLERAKLIRRQKMGREYIIRLHPQPLKEAFKYVEAYKKQWTRHLDALEKFLEKNS